MGRTVRCYTDVDTVSRVWVDVRCFRSLDGRSHVSASYVSVVVVARRRKSISPEATGVIRRAKAEASAGDRQHSRHACSIVGAFRLARCPYRCEARYIDPLASKRLSTVLEVEVSGGRPSAGPGRSSEAG